MSDAPFPAWFQRHHESVHGRLDALQDRIDHLTRLTERLIEMGTTLETDLTAQTAAVQALAGEVTSGLAANAAAIAALQATIANGGTVSAADLSTLEGNTAAIIAATGSLTAALNPPPTPPGPVTS